MPNNTNVNEATQQRLLASDRLTCDDLGVHIRKITAALRAAINCGADEREDEAWLISIAHSEAEEASERYTQWQDADRAGRAS